MKHILFLFAFCFAVKAGAQQFEVQGTLTDTAGAPVAGAAVSLLETSDSTLAHFGISTASGTYRIPAVKGGQYLMQVAAIGYSTVNKPVEIAAGNTALGYTVLRGITNLLAGVEVRSERIPVLLKGDTVEYNAGAFKVKQDAVVEDLLRRLPGVQVDKDGNLKAQGKEVRKVLVDGKEFFGDDPKMATKNLPADAIDKVQVFGNKSAATQFTGIDDGTRDQTINLQLKAGKRAGYFGDVEAGGGTDDRYRVHAKLYRFRPKQQIAALGMLNNINQFGFTFQDYLSFSGGLRGLGGGEGGRINIDDDLPLNFGQPVNGQITSGAAGLNYSTEIRPGNRLSLSYLGNGADKLLKEQSTSQNFLPGRVFTTNESQDEHNRNYAHRLSFSWRADMDSAQQLVIGASAGATTATGRRNLQSASSSGDSLRNTLLSTVRDAGNNTSGSLTASYIRKMKGAWPVWKLSFSGSTSGGETQTEWNNLTTFFLPDTFSRNDAQYQDNMSRQTVLSAATSIVRRLGRGWYAEPGIRASQDMDVLDRSQGFLPRGAETDSLSAKFKRHYSSLRPGLSFRHNTSKRQFTAGLDAELATLRPEGFAARQYRFLRPSVFYQNAYGVGTQVNVSYNGGVNAPSARQLLPLVNVLNPLQRSSGNPLLSPEYAHSINAGWLRFDQFAGTSLLFNLNGTFTKDKIAQSRLIRSDLSEELSYSNVPEDYSFAASAEYDLPVKRLGLRMTFSFEERYTQGLNEVNGALNSNTTFNHNAGLRFSNTKRKKVDLEAGIEADISNTRSSLYASQRAVFYHYNGYAQIAYRPSDRLNFSVNANVDQYTTSTFPEAITVPLLNASASYYFLKGRRGVLTLEGFDLLNRNTAVQRVSQLNYLLEKRSNIIGQYALLSFKYRLSKTEDKGAFSIQMRR